jgi:hypothetical protein
VILLLWAGLASADPRVELYTMGPGDELFSRFGHAAICIEGGELDSRCYNYGSTTIRPLRLIVGFVRATALFEVTRGSRNRMLDKYREQDRRVWRQRLAFSDEQVRELSRRLGHDELPENKHYVYDHFVENCTTRIRDHLDAVTAGALSAPTRNVPWDRTLRDAVREGLSPSLPVAAGIELVTGSYIDRVPTRWEAMFLPDVLREEVAHSLGSIPEEVFTPTRERSVSWPLVGPALLAATGVVWAALARLGGRWAGVASAVILSVVGIALWIVTGAAVAPSFQYNLVAAFFWPTDLVTRSVRWGRTYARVRGAIIVAIATLSLVGVVDQSLVGPAVLAGGLLVGARARPVVARGSAQLSSVPAAESASAMSDLSDTTA